MAFLYYNSDNTAEVRYLTDSITGELVETATVTITLTDTSDVEIVGATWPLTMPHVANGTYRVNLPDTLTLTKGQEVKAIYTADDGAGRHREWCVNYDVVCA